MNKTITHQISRAALTLLMMLAMSLTASATIITLTPNGNYAQLFDGDTLTGTGGINSRIEIMDGATVYLSGVDNTTVGNDTILHRWPGILCYGDAVIVLCGNTTNSVKGGYGSSGIYVPENHTLTIQGSGTLIATGGQNGTGIGSGYGIIDDINYSLCGNIIISGGTITANGGQYGAGIGSSYKNSDGGSITISGGTVIVTGGLKAAGIGSGYDHSDCGNITISGGTVNATGGQYGAGIGSGNYYSECSSINITGGTVTANGGEWAAAIGSGYKNSSCRDITITNGVTQITANIGTNATYTIGPGDGNSTCGYITINSYETGFITQSPYTTFSYTIAFNANGGTGTMGSFTAMYDFATTLTSNHYTRPGYLFEGWATSANGPKEYNDEQSVSNLTQTPGATVTLYAKWIIDPAHLSVNGKVYTIHTAVGWVVFCDLLTENNNGFFTDKTVKLNADISVTRMAGDSDHAFSGTFDGQGHTLTVSYNTTEEVTAPFRYVNGATITNLVTAGTISTSKKYASGMIGRALGGVVNITNCVSGGTINSSINGDGTHGGFVGVIQNSTLTITGSTFSGEMLGASTTLCGGFVGWTQSSNSSTTITNCLFIPTTLQISSGHTFSRASDLSGVTITNSYYTEPLDVPQGKQTHTISGDGNVTVAINGQPTTYSVSGIRAYSMGMVYSNTFYAGVDDTVSLTLGCIPPTGYTCSSYEANAGTLTGTTNPYTLTMPDENVTIQATFVQGGLQGTGTSTDPYLISSSANWDVFAANVTNGTNYSGQFVQLTADITIITMAGSWNSDSNYRAFTGTFDGQGHTLTLNYSSNETHCAPFRVIDGATIQNLHLAGTINAGDQFAAMVGHAYGDCNFTNCRSSITINSSRSGYGTHGGFVGRVRTGTSNFVGCVFDGFFSGPNTHAWGGFVGHVESTSHANFTNCLFAPANSSFDFDTYDSQTFARLRDDNPDYATFTNCYYTKVLGGAQSKMARSIAAGEYVTVAFSGQATDYTISGISAYSAGMVYGNTLYAGDGDAVSLNLGCSTPSGYLFNGYKASAGTLTGTTNPYTLSMPDEDVTIQAVLVFIVNYIDGEGVVHSCSNYTVLRGGHGQTTLEGGWYVVNNDITYKNEEGIALTLNGDVTLILCNGKTMTVTAKGCGINGNGHSLTIYGQSLVPILAGTCRCSCENSFGPHQKSLNPSVANTLSITKGFHAIDVSTYTQHSGNVIVSINATETSLYAGNITINGGSIHANDDRGIRTDNLTINGGRVETNGIISYDNFILGWTNTNDYILSGSYLVNLSNAAVKSRLSITKTRARLSPSAARSTKNKSMPSQGRRCGHTSYLLRSPRKSSATARATAAGTSSHRRCKAIPKWATWAASSATPPRTTTSTASTKTLNWNGRTTRPTAPPTTPTSPSWKTAGATSTPTAPTPRSSSAECPTVATARSHSPRPLGRSLRAGTSSATPSAPPPPSKSLST